MNLERIHDSVTEAIGDKYNDKDLFAKHFNIAIQRVNPNENEESILYSVLYSMQNMLKDYSNSKPRTKGGKVARVLAKIEIALFPFLKNFKIKIK
jgi:hypothetical protein